MASNPRRLCLTRERAASDAKYGSECRLEGLRRPGRPKSLWLIGGPCRDRTYDQEIKSLLLYQLS